MDSLSELVWTVAAIGAVDAVFMLWLAARSMKSKGGRAIVASAEVLGSRARRQRA
jgi:hypothetical protein